MLLKFVALLGLAVAVTAQGYDDYDDEPRPRPAPPRIRPTYSGSSSGGSKQPPPPPVAILKQINRHNEDGSYTYGYESADGSFKIETKLPTGEVKGKYGFVDDTGKVRVVEYGATKYGFEPQGEGITVAPPTLVDETTLKDGSLNPAYQDQYYEPEPAPRPAAPRPRPQPRPQPSYDSYSAPLQFAPAPIPQKGPSPLPSRPASFSGASLSTDIDFGPQIKTAAPVRSFAPQPQHSFRPAPPQQSFSFEPAPIQEEDNYAEPAPAPRPAPQFRPASPPRPAPVQFARPAPIPAPQSFGPPPSHRSPPVTRQSGGGVGILDQLAKDYALPNGGAPALHDISFGYY